MKLIKYSMLGLFILSLVFVAGDSISAPIFSPFPAYYVEYLKQFKGLPGSGALLTGGYSTPSAIHWVAGSTMMSSELKTPQGNYLAEISDLLIDPANGRVSNVVITRIQGMGANIRTSKGEDIGRINDLAIDFADEHCADLLVSHAGGTEGKVVAVRLSALSKGDGNTFVLKTTKAELEAAPTFTWSDMTNHEYTEMLSRQCRGQQ